jgi:hypothetical protein
VQDALDRMDEGGFAAGVIRMLILLARASGSVRRSRLERSNHMLETVEPFASIAPKHKTRIVHRESLIVGFEPDEALRALPKLLPGVEDRARAMLMCREVAGPVEEMSEAVVSMFTRLAEVLDVETGFSASPPRAPSAGGTQVHSTA